MDSSISVQCSFLEDHLPRDFPSQFEFSRSDLDIMEDKQIFICRCISVESYVENENVEENGSIK